MHSFRVPTGWGWLMAENKWRRKARALAALAEDQRGKPEGELAREKLAEILNRHPAAKDFPPLRELAERDLTMAQVAMMRAHGISLEGRWTGVNLAHAIKIMEADYKRRIGAFQFGRGIVTGVAQGLVKSPEGELPQPKGGEDESQSRSHGKALDGKRG